MPRPSNSFTASSDTPVVVAAGVKATSRETPSGLSCHTRPARVSQGPRGCVKKKEKQWPTRTGFFFFSFPIDVGYGSQNQMHSFGGIGGIFFVIRAPRARRVGAASRARLCFSPTTSTAAPAGACDQSSKHKNEGEKKQMGSVFFFTGILPIISPFAHLMSLF